MSPRLNDASVRTVGAGVALPLGFLAVAGVSATSTAVDWAIGLATLLLAVLLGAFFAPRANRPGRWMPILTGFQVALVAVPLGSYAVAAQVATSATSDWTIWIASTAIWGTVGLIFLGLPMIAISAVPVCLWAVAVRAICGHLGLGRTATRS